LTLGVFVGELEDITIEIASRNLDLNLGSDWNVNAANVEDKVAALDGSQFLVAQFLAC
jgi:hypothetical protein